MRLKRHLVATCTMLVGSGVIFTSLYLMNEHGTLGPPKEKSEPVAFEVQAPPPKTVKPRKVERRKSENKSVSPRLAPSPSLGGAIAGISFDLPGFESADFGNAGHDLLGAGAAKNMVMTEDAVDKKPVPRKQTAPEFPAKARQRGIEGYVKLNLFINLDGLVEKVRILEAEPRGIFEESATLAAQQWEFAPAEYNGGPVTGWFKRTVSFRLN